MKKKRLFAALLTGVILACSILQTTGQAAGRWPVDHKKNKLSCRSAVVMELSTGTVLYAKHIHEQHYPASITKIMTALLTLENGSLTDTIRFTKETASIETGASSMYCVPGEKFTVEQVLYGIMLQSANEMCLAAADYVSGSLEGFVDLMNQRVKELGLKNTHFMNPNGLHHDDHYTSAYDMACIAREAWKNETFRKICGTRTYQVSATNKRKAAQILGGQLLNHHQMINGYETRNRYEKSYVLGGKTGYTSMAHSTLVTFAEQDGLQLVAVVMKANSPKQGEPNEYTDTTRILDFGFENFKKYEINTDSDNVNDNLFHTFGRYFNADATPLKLSNASAMVLPKGVDRSEAKQKVSYQKGQKLQEGENVIGRVSYLYGGRTVGATDIIYDKMESQPEWGGVQMKNADARIEKSDKNTKLHVVLLHKLSGIKYSFYGIFSFFRERMILVIVIALLILLAVLMVVKYRMSDRSRRKRRTRRRSLGGGMSLNSSRRSGRRRGKRRRGVDLTSSRPSSGRPRMESSSGMSARRLKKNRKKTKESFGKSFYDF